jgi:hypothetical protein
MRSCLQGGTGNIAEAFRRWRTWITWLIIVEQCHEVGSLSDRLLLSGGRRRRLLLRLRRLRHGVLRHWLGKVRLMHSLRGNTIWLMCLRRSTHRTPWDSVDRA